MLIVEVPEVCRWEFCERFGWKCDHWKWGDVQITSPGRSSICSCFCQENWWADQRWERSYQIQVQPAGWIFSSVFFLDGWRLQSLVWLPSWPQIGKAKDVCETIKCIKWSCDLKCLWSLRHHTLEQKTSMLYSLETTLKICITRWSSRTGG